MSKVVHKLGNDLTIEIQDNPNSVVATFEGSAANDDSSSLERSLEELKQYGKSLIFDVMKLDFCYSNCVKVLVAFAQDFSTRSSLHFIISKNAWQVTSLRMMVSFSPNCTIETGTAGGTTICCHTDTKTEEDSFFAPTGSGTIITRVLCAGCNAILSESSEHFD